MEHVGPAGRHNGLDGAVHEVTAARAVGMQVDKAGREVSSARVNQKIAALDWGVFPRENLGDGGALHDNGTENLAERRQNNRVLNDCGHVDAP